MKKGSDSTGSGCSGSPHFDDPARILWAIEKIDSAIQLSSDVNAVLERVIDEVFAVFQSDRAWLFCPCDPEMAAFNVNFESTQPAYPGAKAFKEAVPMTADMAHYCRRALSQAGVPVIDPPPGRKITNDIALEFNVKSLMCMALKPHIGSAWMFGLHQCDHDRVWTDNEQLLFRMIGNRITTCIGNLLYLNRLQESEDRLRTTLDQAGDALFVIDTAGRILDVNRYACEILGYTKHELRKMSVPDVNPEYPIERVLALINSIQPNQYRTVETVHRRKDGSTFPVELRIGKSLIQGAEVITSVARDVAKRKALEKRNRLLADVVDRSQDFIGIADVNGNAIYVNPAGRQLVGLDSDDAVKRSTIEDYFLPEDVPFVKEKILPAVASDGRWVGEFRFRHFKDGKPVNVLYDLFRTNDPDTGEITNYGTVTRDITERKQAEDALREREDQFRAVAENTSDSIIITDEQGTIIYWNEGSGKIFGYTGEEILGKSIDILLPEKVKQDKDEAMATYDDVRDSTQFGTVQKSYARRKDGSIFPLEVTLSCWEREGSFYFCSIIRDITEREKIEQRFRAIFDSSTDSIIISDSSGMIITCNNATRDVFGYDPGELIGKSVKLLIPQEKRNEVDNHLKQAVLSDPDSGYLTLTHKKDGSEVYINSSLSRWEVAGQTFFSSINRDVTSDKRMEQQLQQSQKMESIGTLAGGIAHDFNNILGAILGNAEMLLDDLPGGDESYWNAEQIRDAAERARHLVKQILAFSRKAPQNFKVFSMVSLLQESITMLRSTLPATVDIETQVSCADAAILGDENQINQVVMNLCVNAEQAMHETGGRLSIAASNVVLTQNDMQHYQGLRPGEYVQLQVGDTGHGIPKDKLDKIFDPFFTTKEVGKGTGLGLSVVHGILQNHKGAISVESVEGTGTTFTVLLPVAAQAETAKPVPEEEPLPGGTGHILLIDDEEPLLAVGKRMLESLGYTVTILQDSEQALTAFREAPESYDAVISDMTMPRMTGKTLCRELLTIRPDLPIILCTGYSDLISDEDCKTIGIRAFIMKPFKKQEIAKTVRDVLDH